MKRILSGLLQYKDGNEWKDIPALDGQQGDKGDTGATPNLSIGTVTELLPSESPTATLTGTTASPVLNLGIPKGATGQATEETLAPLLVNKADVIVDSASGSIATFTDGADDTPIKSMSIDIVPTETGTGEKSAENPWTIGGWASCRLEHAGKNLFDIRNVYSYDSQTPTSFTVPQQYYFRDFYTNSTGSGSDVSQVDLPKLPYLKKGTYKTYYSSGDNIHIYSVNSDGSTTSVGNGFNNYPFTLDKDTRITIRKRPTNASTYTNFMITIGDRTVYEPYKGTIYPIPFGSTIYGGQISIAQDGTVKLKVYPYYSSYNGEELTGKWVSSMDEYVAGTTPTTGAFVVDLSGQYTEEITLTPITPIKTLLGVNNLWADTGDVSVQYRADTKLYIDKKVASLV